jgi:hypothetical protein
MAAFKTRSQPLLGVIALVAFVALTGCQQEGRPSALGEIDPTTAPSPSVKVELSAPLPYVPLAGEPVPEIKQLAADVLQAIGTYKKGQGTVQGATARLAGRAAPAVAQSTERLLLPDAASAVDIVYPQLSGLTSAEAGIMAVFRHRILENGDERSVTRAADLRFQRTSAGWIVSAIDSVGGEPPPAPARPLTQAAQAVLDSDRINLPDSARWAIENGVVDDRVLEVLLRVGEQHTVDVTVFASAHPRNVFASESVSNHTVGRAVDIWAVDGKEVVAQREQGGPLYQLVQMLMTYGITELGSPWDLDGAGTGASFTNTVHLDHLHLAFDG